MVCCMHPRSVDPIRLLVNWGANLELVDSRGNTAIHIAVLNANFAAILLLDEYKVNWLVTNADGLYPYQVSGLHLCFTRAVFV